MNLFRLLVDVVIACERDINPDMTLMSSKSGGGANKRKLFDSFIQKVAANAAYSVLIVR